MSFGRSIVAKKTPLVLEKFYRTELRRNEEIIDNRSKTIADELRISKSLVNQVLDEHLDEKFNVRH